MELPRRFPYNPQWRIILFGFAFGGVFLICVKIPWMSSAIGHWMFLAIGFLCVTFGSLLMVRRLAFPKFLQVEQDSVLIPKGFLRTWVTKISYSDIENGWETVQGSTRSLNLQVKGRTFEILSIMLPDMGSYVAIKDFVKSRFTQKEGPKVSEPGQYCFQCTYEGNGTIHNSIGEVLWQVKTMHLRRPRYPYGFFRLPDFVVYGAPEKELYRIKRKRSLVFAEYVMIENGSVICTIKQRSIFLNKYMLEFANGQKWTFRMPLFTVNFAGASESGAKIRVRLRTHNFWYVLIDIAADNPELVAALAFIHRERLRCI